MTRPATSEPHSGESSGADDRDRTGDLVLTKDALCQLSYIGLRAFGASADKSASTTSQPLAGLSATVHDPQTTLRRIVPFDSLRSLTPRLRSG